MAMIGGLPDGTARWIGGAILQTSEILALNSVLCIAGAIACLFLAKHAGSGWAKLLRWFALLLVVAAAGPAVFVVLAISS
jgi:hypothetical protein